MNQNTKNIIISSLIAIFATIGITALIPKSAPLQSGQINADIRRMNSNTYTYHMGSSTASRFLLNTAGCLGLEIENTNGNATRIYLQATSTGVFATSGIRLAVGQSYTPEFVWTGEGWTITESGTSSLTIQCSK